MTDFCNMSRKTRTRQTRIRAALQSGYCAICHLPYNNLDDHIQSKKHLKLIGEDANYISINGFIDQNTLEPFLNLTGIDSIDINGKDFYPRTTRNNGNRNLKPSPIDSPAKHHLRSRKRINYALSPSIEEEDVVEKETKTKSCETVSEPIEKNIEVWNSGRPKRRSCIKTKQTSSDDTTDNKSLYKVELRSSGSPKDIHVQKQQDSTNAKDDKGLIVKFKKMRNKQLDLLNMEAENFMFPKHEVQEEVVQQIGNHEEDRKPIFVEEDGSMDSTTSSGKGRKKRRTHAEAFIMDNQKYYKFETPGSRLRYHGTMFNVADGIKSPRRNGDIAIIAKQEALDVVEEEPLLPLEPSGPKELDLDNYWFSFEMVPKGETWYESFRRQDLGEESYMYLPDDCDSRFIMPSQLGPSAIQPLDPKVCIAQYIQLKKVILEQAACLASGSNTTCSTPGTSESSSSSFINNLDEDSKMSTIGEEEGENNNKNAGKRSITDGRNPRKSPRQHASTLAILGSLIPHRKKRPKSYSLPGSPFKTNNSQLTTIPEERTTYEEIWRSWENVEDVKTLDAGQLSPPKPKCPVQLSQKLDVLDVLRIYDGIRSRDDSKANRRFINGTQNRKPAKRKLNKTGWPNKKRTGSIKKEGETTDSIKSVNISDSDIDRLEEEEEGEEEEETCNVFQPIVKVEKLETDECVENTDISPIPKKRANKRRMPASPRSPRSLRRPRGRWYKER